MKNFFQTMDWENWFKGLWAAVVAGGANAVVAGIGINISDPGHFNAQNAAFYKTVCSVFAVGVVTSFFLYLKQKPLPEQLISKTTTTLTVEKTIESKPE